MNRVYLSLGSNINPEINFVKAVQLLASATELVAVSSVWETAPLGLPHQPNYLNGVVVVHTTLSAMALKMQVLMEIEQTLGRVRQSDNKFGPRSIDIDIMLFNRDVMQLGERHIPDAEILARAFVALPLAEVDPTYIHPETGQSLADIAAQFGGDESMVRQRPAILLQIQQFLK